jgi:hypothetical protein
MPKKQKQVNYVGLAAVAAGAYLLLKAIPGQGQQQGPLILPFTLPTRDTGVHNFSEGEPGGTPAPGPDPFQPVREKVARATGGSMSRGRYYSPADLTGNFVTLAGEVLNLSAPAGTTTDKKTGSFYRPGITESRELTQSFWRSDINELTAPKITSTPKSYFNRDIHMERYNSSTPYAPYGNIGPPRVERKTGSAGPLKTNTESITAPRYFSKDIHESRYS